MHQRDLTFIEKLLGQMKLTSQVKGKFGERFCFLKEYCIMYCFVKIRLHFLPEHLEAYIGN